MRGSVDALGADSASLPAMRAGASRSATGGATGSLHAASTTDSPATDETGLRMSLVLHQRAPQAAPLASRGPASARGHDASNVCGARAPSRDSAHRRRLAVVRRHEVRQEQPLLRRQRADALRADLVEDAVDLDAIELVQRRAVDRLVVAEPRRARRRGQLAADRGVPALA